MKITQIIRLPLIIFSLMLFPFTVLVGFVCAETQYVSDQLVITLREGQGKEFKIIKMLKSGAPLEIIEESEQHLKVRTRSGLEGWVLKQYVTGDIPKVAIIADLKQTLDRLNTQIGQYNKERESFQDQLQAASSDHNNKTRDLQQSLSASRGKAEQTSRDLKKITKKHNALLTASKDVVVLVQERDDLKASNSDLQTRTDHLQQENDELKRSQMIWWFVAGGSVFFVGWIAGKISRQKRFY